MRVPFDFESVDWVYKFFCCDESSTLVAFQGCNFEVPKNKFVIPPMQQMDAMMEKSFCQWVGVCCSF